MDGFTTLIMLVLAGWSVYKIVRRGWPAFLGVFSLKHPFRKDEAAAKEDEDDLIPPGFREAEQRLERRRQAAAERRASRTAAQATTRFDGLRLENLDVRFFRVAIRITDDGCQLTADSVWGSEIAMATFLRRHPTDETRIPDHMLLRMEGTRGTVLIHRARLASSREDHVSPQGRRTVSEVVFEGDEVEFDFTGSNPPQVPPPTRRLPFEDIPEARQGEQIVLSQVTLEGNILAHGVTFTPAEGSSFTVRIDRLIAPALGLDRVLETYTIERPRAMIMHGYGRAVTLQGVFLTERESWLQANDMRIAERLTFMAHGFTDEPHTQASPPSPPRSDRPEPLTAVERVRFGERVAQLERQQERERQQIARPGGVQRNVPHDEVHALNVRHSREWAALLQEGRMSSWLRRLCEQAIHRLGSIHVPEDNSRPVGILGGSGPVGMVGMTGPIGHTGIPGPAYDPHDPDGSFAYEPPPSRYTDRSLPPIPPRPRAPNVRSIDLDGGTDGQETQAP